MIKFTRAIYPIPSPVPQWLEPNFLQYLQELNFHFELLSKKSLSCLKKALDGQNSFNKSDFLTDKEYNFSCRLLAEKEKFVFGINSLENC